MFFTERRCNVTCCVAHGDSPPIPSDPHAAEPGGVFPYGCSASGTATAEHIAAGQLREAREPHSEPGGQDTASPHSPFPKCTLPQFCKGCELTYGHCQELSPIFLGFPSVFGNFLFFTTIKRLLISRDHTKKKVWNPNPPKKAVFSKK